MGRGYTEGIWHGKKGKNRGAGCRVIQVGLCLHKARFLPAPADTQLCQASYVASEFLQWGRQALNLPVLTWSCLNQKLER